MAGEEKTHTAGEVEILVAVAEIKTMQSLINASVSERRREDDGHFKEIFSQLDKVPGSMHECREGLKTDLLSISRREFTADTDFQVFKTTVLTSVKTAVIVGTIAGSIIGSLITYFIKVTA